MISIIVSWRDRMELAQALPAIVASAESLNGDVTIVNYGGNHGLLADVLSGVHSLFLRIVHVPAQLYFNKSRAHNIGVAATNSPLLFFCDCDIILAPDILSELSRGVLDRPGTFGTIAGIVESEKNSRAARNIICFGYELNIRIGNGRQLTIKDSEEDAETGARQAPGLLLVRRSDFLAINGYNGRLLGWGWEDQDMIARLTLGAGLRRETHGIVVHLSHGDQQRIGHYPPVKDRWESRDRMFRQALENYDASNFNGTYSTDIKELTWSAAPSTMAT